MGEKKWINTAAVLFTLKAYQTAEPLLSCFQGKKWKTKLENTEEGKVEKENMYFTRIKLNRANKFLFFYFVALNRWLPRVTVGVPSPITVVKFISLSSVRSSSVTTSLIEGRLSLEGSRHRSINCMNSSIPSLVKVLHNLSSRIFKRLLKSRLFCTF